MTRIFIKKENIEGDTVSITGGDSVHIASALRMRRGENIIFCDGEGTDFLCEIESASPKLTTARIISEKKSEAEPDHRITLYQSLCKGDKFEFIIQKATELGVYSIVPVISERCVSRPDEKSLSNKVSRWQTIAREAAQQSGRGTVPRIADPVDIKRALKEAKDGLRLFCYENETAVTLKDAVVQTSDICVFVGPEGGYSQGEYEAAAEAGFTSVSLGRRILRCETAPLFVLSSLVYALEL